MIGYRATIFGLLGFLGWEANAGELKIAVSSFTPTALAVSPTPTSGDLELTLIADNQWRISFKDKTQYQAALTISIDAPPNGYQPFKLTFDIPYYWESSTERTLPAALANDNVYNNGVATFLNDRGALPGKLPELGLVNQRARRIWSERHRALSTNERLPNPDDVRIAYWLLLSTNELIQKAAMEIDQGSQTAIDWISGLLEQPDESRRLLRTDTVPAEDFRELLGTLSQRDAYVYNKIVQQMSADIASDNDAEVQDACARAASLDNFFEGLDVDQLGNYDGQFANSVITKTNVVICNAREATAMASPSAEAVMRGQTIAEQLDVLLNSRSSDDVSPQVRANAVARVLDLGQVLGF